MSELERRIVKKVGIRSYVRDLEMRAGDGLTKRLDEAVRELIDRAAKRAKSNKRCVVRPDDV